MTREFSLSFQGSALERTAFEAPPHVFVTQEAGASNALRSQAEPGNEFLAREGEAPAEPLRRWLGRSLALPKVLTGLCFAKMSSCSRFLIAQFLFTNG